MSDYKLPRSRAFTTHHTFQLKEIAFNLAVFIHFDFGLVYCGNFWLVVAVVVWRVGRQSTIQSEQKHPLSFSRDREVM